MKISNSRKILILLLVFLLLLPSVRVDAASGNIFVFLHSEDFWAGSEKKVDSYRACLKSYKSTTRLDARPTIVYGMQQHLKNCGSLFICCHGLNEGSVLVMDIVGTEFILFRTSDVPKNMDCNLAFLGACRSAQKNTTTGKNLCSTLVSNGYKTVVGYNTDVNNPFAIEFEENFFYYLGQGKSVYASIEEAKKDLRDKKNDKIEHEKIINAVEGYGNLGLTIE